MIELDVRPLTPQERKTLTARLAAMSGEIAADLRAKIQVPGAAQDRALRLHAEEGVSEAFQVWTDLLARRAAVLWVLKTVYVRVLEDRNLISPKRIVDSGSQKPSEAPESQQLFERLAPNLGETAYLRWVFRDLAQPAGGLPELFTTQPAEVAEPSDALSRRLLALWRETDVDAGRLLWSLEGERFEGSLMGDLYQDLDPVVRERFALLQTPNFVRDFILDQTLTPVLEEWPADQIRILDPACGSGHFLLEAFRRLVAATAWQHPEWGREETVRHALGRVVGIDLNDYACALARARLVMTASELAGLRTLAEASRFHPHVYWADALEQVERDSDQTAWDPELVPVRATMTQPDVRHALKQVLTGGFHVVVANPPYITEKDARKKEYHREKLGRTRRYVSAYREYSLASPFTERCFQLARPGGWVGLITSNNFMKREFGKALITEVLATKDLFEVVDTSGAYIPGHGTPTALLFARNRHPVGQSVRVAMGKRGEPSAPEDPAKGRVWSSILEGHLRESYESEHISVAAMDRSTLAKHPWSLGGGGAAELKVFLDSRAQDRLGDLASDLGFGGITREDEVYVLPAASWRRWRFEPSLLAVFAPGDAIRDWAVTLGESILLPYTENGTVSESALGRYLDVLWKDRARLWLREGKGFKTKKDSGGAFFEYSMFYPDRHFTPRKLAYAFVATHNHFVLDRGGKVFNRSAPVIKLPPGSTVDAHLALLGLLNSSTACFWMKQVFHCKGLRGQGGGITAESWEQFYEFDGTKIKAFPIPAGSCLEFARRLDRLAADRQSRSVASVLAGESWSSPADLADLLADRRRTDTEALLRMVAIQEELDWLCYRLYGLDPENEVLDPEDLPVLEPGLRPFELALAARDAEIRSALAAGEDPGESPTAWFERHRWEPRRELSADLPESYRQLLLARLARTEANSDLALIEQPAYKRRWYRPDYEAEERAAMRLWLAEQVESALETRSVPATARQIAARLQGDARILAVAELYRGRPDFDLADLVAELLQADAVPSHPFHLYKDTGLAKRAQWEETWEQQRREDAGEEVTPDVPPTYTGADFLRPEHFQLRGKLDVPKERFIAFTEAPGKAGPEAVYGWAGWTPREHVKALLALDEEADNAGYRVDDRIALLDSAWRLLTDVARERPDGAGSFRAEIQALVGQDGPSAKLLAEWKEKYPPPGSARSRAARGTKGGR